jgi:hypothetical protein
MPAAVADIEAILGSLLDPAGHCAAAERRPPVVLHPGPGEPQHPLDRGPQVADPSPRDTSNMRVSLSSFWESFFLVTMHALLEEERLGGRDDLVSVALGVRSHLTPQNALDLLLRPLVTVSLLLQQSRQENPTCAWALFSGPDALEWLSPRGGTWRP